MSRAFDLGRSTFRPAALGLSGLARQLYGANSPELAEGAKVLRRSIVKVLSVRGGGRLATSLRTRRRIAIGGTPSRAGEPPRRQAGNLVRSIIQGKVDEGRRIAAMWFTGPLLEQGVNTNLPIRSGRRRRTGGVAKRRLIIAPRPFMQRAIDAAAPSMVGVMATLGTDHLTQLVDG